MSPNSAAGSPLHPTPPGPHVPQGIEALRTISTHAGLPGFRKEHMEWNFGFNMFDLDGNDYFACSVKDAPPWGPAKGRGGRK